MSALTRSAMSAQAGHDPEDELALRDRGVGVLAIADEIDA
jgi:hypothetical protein